MEIITISGLKDTDEFKKNKEYAWKYIIGEGNFNIDDFEPAQYKYFDKLLQLYGKLHSESITKEQAKAEDEKNYAELESYVDERLEYIHDRLLYQKILNQLMRISEKLKNPLTLLKCLDLWLMQSGK